MMSDVVQRAKAALEGVTEGPWEVGQEIDGLRAGMDTVVRARNGDSPFGPLRVVTVDQTRNHFGSTRDTYGQDVANVAFIAAARQLIPDLIAEVERWEALIEEFRLRDESATGVIERLQAERDTARAEVERLTPRRIKTVAELDALRIGTVVLSLRQSDIGDIYANWADHHLASLYGPWFRTGYEVPCPSDEVDLPAIVLHTPDVDS